ncbi:MAG TPA: hypothetical protein PKW33_07695 [Anaerolineaceae bacterium]|nr:hypothetical protein [Anaerolineaceae bacterium]HPN51455.1 hypothetical protein [Anaerolineaceae bacterium]
MYRIADLAGHALTWVQPDFLKMEYELRLEDGQPAASLVFRSSFGTFATAESGDGCWTFKRVGFWQNKASIRACSAEVDLAEFHNNTWSSGGTLIYPNGRHFKATTNFWMTQLQFRLDEEPLVNLKIKSGFKLSAEVSLLPAGLQQPELPVLTLFAWYLAVMLSSDAAATMAATAAV